MKKPLTDEVYSKEEREVMLEKMCAASHRFYSMAIGIGCHTFIELSGLMSEFISMCAAAQKQGIDFTQANTHTGVVLPMHDYQAEYIAEKLGCIYGPSLAQNKAAREAFIRKLFEGRFKLVEADNDRR